jgi:drug efflux transport system permease protein
MTIRLSAMIRKEFTHLFRDPGTLVTILLFPIIYVFLFSYVAGGNVRDVPTAVYDADQTHQSRQLLDAYRASGYFSLTQYVASEEEIVAFLDRGTVNAGFIIPPGFGADVMHGGQAQIAVLIDGSNPSIGTGAYAAAQAIGQAYGARIKQQQFGLGTQALGAIDVRPRVLYNPDLNPMSFMVPGLAALILGLMTTQFTAASIVKEREQGTIEQLVVTPIRPWELNLGKVTPYVCLSFINLVEILVVAVLWFGVPIRGSLPFLIIAASLFVMTTLGVGLFISANARTNQESQQLSDLFTLPSFFLSGILFPVEAMPGALQVLSYLVPARYIVLIFRSVMLKGVGVESVGGQTIVLAFAAAIMIIGASLTFKKSLE